MVDFQKERWPIEQADRELVVKTLLALVQGDDHPVSIRAARLLLLLDAENLKWEQKASELVSVHIRQLIRERELGDQRE